MALVEAFVASGDCMADKAWIADPFHDRRPTAILISIEVRRDVKSSLGNWRKIQMGFGKQQSFGSGNLSIPAPELHRLPQDAPRGD